MTGLGSEGECTLCPGGMYCDEVGLTEPKGDCGEGYYCPLGTSQEQPAATYCPVGHYCPTGQAMPLPCRNNTHVSLI